MSKKISEKKQIEIEVKLRSPGKSASRRLRREHFIPSVLYGPKKTNKTFSLSELEATKYSSHKYDNSIFVLKSKEDPDLNDVPVLKKDIEFHPLTRSPIHVDFYAIDKSKRIRVSVELQFIGKSLGEKEGGIFNVIRRDVEIECLPESIPRTLPVDISALKLDDALHVSDIQIPKNIKLVTLPRETVATVSMVEEEKESASTAQAGGEISSEAQTAAEAPATEQSSAAAKLSSKSEKPQKSSGAKK